MVNNMAKHDNTESNDPRRGDPNWMPPAGYEFVMDDGERADEPGSINYAGRLWRRRWLVAAILAPCIAATVFLASRAEPSFVATARMRLGVQTPKIAPFQPTEERSDFRMENMVQTQVNIFQNRSLASQVVEQLGYNPPESPKSAIKEKVLALFAIAPETPEPADEATRRERAIDSFLAGLTVVPIADTQIFEARYASSDPEFSARALNALSDAYLRNDFQAKSASYSEARRWIQNKMEEVRTSLARSEEALYKFAGADGAQFMTLSDGGLQYLKEIDEMRLKIATLEDERAKRRADRDRIAAGGLPEDAAGATGAASLASQLRGQLATAETELDKVNQTLGPMDSNYKNAAAARDRIAAQLNQEKARLLKIANVQLQQAEGQLAQLRRDLDERQQRVIGLQQRLSGYNTLKREVDMNRETYNNLLQKWQEIGIGQSIQPADAVILQRAERPLVPIQRARNNILLYGMIISLCLSFGGALLADRLDNSLRSSEEIWRLSRLETLGNIPRIPTLRSGGKPLHAGLLMREKPDSAAAAGFRSLRTAVELVCEMPRSVLVTSAVPGEGKTTIAANLAISFTQKGRSVLLIDADLQNGILHRVFEITGQSGLAELLGCGRRCIDEFVSATSVPRLCVLPSGAPGPNAADLLDADSMRQVIEIASERFDMIVIDSVSPRGLADAGAAASNVDAVIIVAEPEKTPRREFTELNRLLGVLGARVAGVALNNSRPEATRIHEIHRPPRERAAVEKARDRSRPSDQRIKPAAAADGI